MFSMMLLLYRQGSSMPDFAIQELTVLGTVVNETWNSIVSSYAECVYINMMGCNMMHNLISYPLLSPLFCYRCLLFYFNYIWGKKHSWLKLSK